MANEVRLWWGGIRIQVLRGDLGFGAFFFFKVCLICLEHSKWPGRGCWQRERIQAGSMLITDHGVQLRAQSNNPEITT